MSTWILIGTIGAVTWLLLALLTARALGLATQDSEQATDDVRAVALSRPKRTDGHAFVPQPAEDRPIRVLVVDDDGDFRQLLRTTFETAHVEVDEAESATSAAQRIAGRHPDVLVLDVAMPGLDGITFCRALKADPRTRNIPVILLTGNSESELSGRSAGASAFLRKPFSPLELLQLVERCAERSDGAGRPAAIASGKGEGQLLLYAHDFRHLLELERGQRRLLQNAYRETVVALAQALEAKDGGTSAHSERVRRYATELAALVEPSLLHEPGVEYGFILHDVGKIAIPDAVLGKAGVLTPSERRLLETHPVLGEQMVGNSALLRGHGAEVVRSHHERWDGRGYPDGLVGDRIPLPARIFAVADALDAMTSDRPYRSARPWPAAVKEIVEEAGAQFDPAVVAAFRDRQDVLRRVYYEVSAN